MRHFNYKDYFLEMRKAIDDADSELPKEKKMEASFKIMFENKLEENVKRAWQEAENIERESYKLSDDELEKVWDDSIIEYTSDLLKNMLEMGLIKMSIREDGEVVYSISDEGKLLLEINKE